MNEVILYVIGHWKGIFLGWVFPCKKRDRERVLLGMYEERYVSGMGLKHLLFPSLQLAFSISINRFTQKKSKNEIIHTKQYTRKSYIC